mgnify:CR=1 FL=1
MREHKIVGNKWTEIAKAVGGRTDNAVKNRYAALMTKQSGGTASGGVKKKKPPTTTMPTTSPEKAENKDNKTNKAEIKDNKTNTVAKKMMKNKDEKKAPASVARNRPVRRWRKRRRRT